MRTLIPFLELSDCLVEAMAYFTGGGPAVGVTLGLTEGAPGAQTWISAMPPRCLSPYGLSYRKRTYLALTPVGMTSFQTPTGLLPRLAIRVQVTRSFEVSIQ